MMQISIKYVNHMLSLIIICWAVAPQRNIIFKHWLFLLWWSGCVPLQFVRQKRLASALLRSQVLRGPNCKRKLSKQTQKQECAWLELHTQIWFCSHLLVHSQMFTCRQSGSQNLFCGVFLIFLFFLSLLFFHKTEGLSAWKHECAV